MNRGDFLNLSDEEDHDLEFYRACSLLLDILGYIIAAVFLVLGVIPS